MNIGILHLTDLHIKSSENFLLSRIEKIHDSLRIDILKLERIYVVITGDIVDKGTQSAYSQAKKILLDLKTKLESINKKLIIGSATFDCKVS